MTSSRAVLRLARRDLRGGLAGLGTFVGCVALGTMAIVAVGSVAASLRAGVAAQGREIVGADAAFSFAGRPPPPGFRAFLATRGATAGIALTTAMARAADGAAAPVAVKAVGPSWPTVGAATFEPAMSAGQALAPRDGAFGAAAEDTLFARLGLKVGDEIKLGAATLRMNAALRAEPDSLAAGIGFAPRLLISRGALAASGLLGPGALYTSVERALLPAGADDRAVARLVADAKRAFPDAGFVARTRLDAAPEFASDLARFAQFLELVGLSSLLVGGVGVANAATAFVARKRDTLATLKALGASGAAAFAIVGAQAAAIAALGIAIGLAAGAALPFALAAFGGTLIPFPLRAAVYPAELARGAAFGALSAAAFALPPLGRAHDAPVQALFRGEAGGARGRPRRAYLAAALACALALAGFAVVTAPDRRLAAYFLAAALGAFLALRALGFGMTRLARRLPRPRGFAARLALSNLHRPGAPTTTVVVSLGLGLALLVALAGIDETLHGAIAGAAPAGAPSFFFVDVKPAEADAFDAFLARAAPGAARRRAPLLRGRIVEIAGAPADPAKVDPDVRWMLRGDRGLTTSEGVPDGSRVTAGAWWPKGYSGPPLVSLDGTAARGLGVKVGDEIGVDVLGRRIRAKVANLRKVDWKRVGVNFILVFPPSAFAGAPHTWLETLAWTEPTPRARELALMSETAGAFPDVTAVRVKDALDAVAAALSRLAVAVRVAAGVALATAALTLAGALAAGRAERLRDAVVLKALGATRARLVGAYVIEFAALGLVTAAFGAAAGALAARWIVGAVMKLDFVAPWGAMAGAAGIALAVALGLGLADSLRALRAPPARALREP